MATHQEPLTGGLVTSRDPALLDTGQLSYLQNAVYKPDASGLHRSPGRTQFGVVSASATAVVGLRDVKFDNGDAYLIAHAGTKYRYAPVGVTGTFTDLATVASGSQLEVVHYRNRFFLMNGATQSTTATAAGTNLVVYLSATGAGTAPSTRQHGMLPVVAAPLVTTGSGVFSQTVSGYYEYWTTEVSKFTQDGGSTQIEGTFVGTPTTVFVSSTAVVPTISRPDIVNTAAATHWRVYRSTKKDAQADKRFPTGFMISSDISIAATSFSDTQTVASASAFPANFNGIADSATVYIDMGAQATALASDTNVRGTMTSTGLTNYKQQGVYGFNFGGFTGSVKGIQVEVECGVDTGTNPVGVTIVRQRQADGGFVPVAPSPLLQGLYGQLYTKLNTASKSFVATTTLTTVYTLGGSTDRWFANDNARPLADSDFNTSFMVLLTFASTSGTKTLSVDFVRVTVYYGGAIDSVVPFPTVVYTFGDVAAQVGKNGPPPSSSTGDLYEDSLVLNDVTSQALIRYSFPGDPEAFPPTYYLDFETRENDIVRAIRVVNNRLVVMLDTSTWRVNYLPSERDASFDRGKAVEPVSRSYGCVNPMCACAYSPGGGVEKLAVVSHKGIFATDGYNFEWLTDAIDWRQIMPLTGTTDAIALINDPEEQCLRYFWRDDAGTGQIGTVDTYLELRIHYDGRISGNTRWQNVSGVNEASVESAWSVPVSAGGTNIYVGYGGTGGASAAGAGAVYIENGSNIPAHDPAWGYVTRRMYLAGFGGEWRLDQMHDYGAGSGHQITYRTRNLKTNATSEGNPQTIRQKTLAGEPVNRYNVQQTVEGLRIQCVTDSTQSDMNRQFLMLDWKDFGVEESGK